ncbi:long-chain-fatty-acid--CoA ligase [Stagnimonas aquatica]|uniref:Long-chain-fatty-acid--CoA ligase n=1 Tax=Stagnimonas aquatica TaxID=2689987 RepID=A0A3N0VKL1_9GAMM|nr:AMP-binding protein [Stagnimonas aquatica]ROH93265.1 long-chain-fatty-acid--CoA ligase [Stagnimonas aquatica]
MAKRGAAEAEKVWLNEYGSDVPAEIDPSTFSSVAELVDRSCEKFRDLTAYECMGDRLSYDDVDRLSQDFASYLQNVLGFHKGDRVAVMMPNLLQYPVAIFGILRAGMVVVNVNPLYTPRELEHQLKDAGARGIVIVENFCTTLQEVLGRTPVEVVITTQVGDMASFPKSLITNFVVKRVKKMVPAWSIPGAVPFRTALARGKAQPMHRMALGHEDVAFLQYTGGTTGLSKGATLSHGNIIANLMQMRAWMGGHLVEGEDLVVTALPLYHVFALTVNCLLFLSVGGKNVLITNPRDMPGFVKELSKHRFTAFTGVNTLFNGLLNTPGFAEIDFSALKFTVGGGAAVQQAVAGKWREVTGRGLTEGYGLSETSPGVCFGPLHQPDWNGTIGLPLPSTDVSLRDDDHQPVPVGVPGELCVKGPQVMRGYWNKPEENAKVFTPDGYLKTGDVAVMSESGYFKIVDRKKDMILVSGFNVYPNEIEDVVARHPGVLECACIGIPDAKTGEAVKVFVVKKDAALTVEALREHCKELLTGYKVPKLFEFIEALPKSNVGKILRKELRGK